ncbi:DUF916 and DUF3324 domain-containing protein [Enterococcus casseliflavus]|uniref:DUF916 and DUF3324 domain-containing protein n=1 Tax=Enterococcus casseliflavus TaxID=37734 RepID=UPI00254328FD|nr:DUF916 and DUF3324 domain-containing protein [Enterococcus casseliflavus]MDK4449669.1 DUF916 and DUF3324 domain-containing protein [Enterococcus casseliflavus]
MSVIFGLSLFFVSLFPLSTETTASSNKVNFTAEAILPDNQISEASYYDLQVEQGTSQNLNLQLKNTSSEKITVKIAGNNAITNRNGTLDYSQHGEKLLNSPSFEELISAPQSIYLNPNEEQTITFQLTIPVEGFMGTILGGFYCYEEKIDDKVDTGSDGFSLTNKFAFSIGVKLRCSNEEIEPKLDISKVKPGLDNGYLTVFGTIDNPQPVLLSQLDMKATIKEKGHKEVLHKLQQKVSLAPSSSFELPISWENEPLKAGDYQLSIQLKNASGKKWQMEKEFQIKSSDQKLNHQAVELKEDRFADWFYVITGLFLIVILSLVLYIVKLRHNQQ